MEQKIFSEEIKSEQKMDVTSRGNIQYKGNCGEAHLLVQPEDLYTHTNYDALSGSRREISDTQKNTQRLEDKARLDTVWRR